MLAKEIKANHTFSKNKMTVNNQFNNAECFLKLLSGETFFNNEKRTFQMHQDKFKNSNILEPEQQFYHLSAFNQLFQIQDQVPELKCLSHSLPSQSI